MPRNKSILVFLFVNPMGLIPECLTENGIICSQVVSTTCPLSQSLAFGIRENIMNALFRSLQRNGTNKTLH